MKKIIIIILTLTTIVMLTKNVKAIDNMIPDSAIRLRVIANSNTPYDQYIKLKVRDRLQQEVYMLLEDAQNINQARVTIKDELKSLKDIIEEVLKEEQYNKEYTIDYGQHYFPNKEYKGITYKEGYYESLLVDIGTGEGNNWWCVLFPPLCLLEAEDSSNVEYKFFVKEIIDKFL
jgi:stage II sporulation protein R